MRGGVGGVALDRIARGDEGDRVNAVQAQRRASSSNADRDIVFISGKGGGRRCECAGEHDRGDGDSAKHVLVPSWSKTGISGHQRICADVLKMEGNLSIVNSLRRLLYNMNS